MIIIGIPEVVLFEDKARLQTSIDIDGLKKQIWFDVDTKYKEYLCYERSDAFVIGVLSYAMRNGHDITCEAPIGEELHYQISIHLIDALYKSSKKLYNTKIFAEIDNTILSTGNAVGTGISCGIDSFHAISTHSSTIYPNHNITHLAFNNVGSHGEGEKALQLYNARKNLAKDFAREYDYEFVESDSNIHDVISQNHLFTHTYTSCFAIYCLQKLYSLYYYASSQVYFDFSLKDNEKYGSGYYDLLTLSVFATKTLRILSEGATLTRLDKTKEVVNYIPSFKYLNVCTSTFENCNRCEKCARTLLALDALGKLDDYSGVFNIEYYKNNMQRYYSRLVFKKLLNIKEYNELYPLLKHKIAFSAKIKGYANVIKSKILK